MPPWSGGKLCEHPHYCDKRSDRFALSLPFGLNVHKVSYRPVRLDHPLRPLSTTKPSSTKSWIARQMSSYVTIWSRSFFISIVLLLICISTSVLSVARGRFPFEERHAVRKGTFICITRKTHIVKQSFAQYTKDFNAFCAKRN